MTGLTGWFGGVSIEDYLAGLRLHEAAPDLLAALQDCCTRMERARGILSKEGNWAMLDTEMARATIAKATGETK